MEKELRILILEDEPNDAELMERELRKGGMSFISKRVETREDFFEAVKNFGPDLILADCLLPSFDGLSALEIAQKYCPRVPFIFVSGAVGEDFAVETFKRGGTDYILKQRLTRLVPAVNRALREVKERAEHKRLEEALWTSAKEWRTTFDVINDTVALMDSEGRILRCNKAMANLLERPFDNIIGHRCFELLHGTSEPIKECPFLRMQKTHWRESLVWAVRDRWFNIAVDPLTDQEGKIVGGVHIMSDITERKQMEEKLRTLSFIDDLTGLYNRRGFLTLAEQQVKISNRTKGKMLLIFIDLDHMKWINDTFGHPEGDHALREMATILRETFRESDIIARMGGDEFVVLTIEGIGESEDLLTARLQENIACHNNGEGNPNFKLSISMGAATYDPGSPCLIDELLGRADQSMYEQKRTKQKNSSQ
jgi:diguanylate cyclase (GGDEF)-like protein/PAS domain S-box-containing protein